MSLSGAPTVLLLVLCYQLHLNNRGRHERDLGNEVS